MNGEKMAASKKDENKTNPIMLAFRERMPL